MLIYGNKMSKTIEQLVAGWKLIQNSQCIFMLRSCWSLSWCEVKLKQSISMSRAKSSQSYVNTSVMIEGDPKLIWLKQIMKKVNW